MSNKTSGKKPEVVVGAGSHPGLTMPRLSKKRLLIIAAILAVTAAGVGLYLLTRPSSGIPIVTIDGKEYTADWYTSRNMGDKEPETIVATKQIEDLEKKVASPSAAYTDYLALAQLYVQEKNTSKAIENYERAKQKADPNMKDYDSFVANIDRIIGSLKDK